MDAPHRTWNDLRRKFGMQISAPFGAFIKTVSLIIDEKSMPVSATFGLAELWPDFAFSGAMRITEPSAIRIAARCVDTIQLEYDDEPLFAMGFNLVQWKSCDPIRVFKISRFTVDLTEFSRKRLKFG